MRKPTISLVLALALLASAAPRPAAAQDGARFGFAGGLNISSAPGVSGQHLFGSALFPRTPIPGIAARIDATVLSDLESGKGTVHLLGNLRAPVLGGPTLNGYVIGGAGYAIGSWSGPVLNGGLGVEKLTGGRPIFLEYGIRLWGGYGPSSGIMMLSFGTMF